MKLITPIAPKYNAALVLIDLISHCDLPRPDALHRFAMPAAARIAGLKKRARRAQIPTMYANDNLGRWRSDFQQQVEKCLEKGRRDAISSNPTGPTKMIICR